MEIENVATEQVVNEQPQQETEVQSEPKFTQAEVDKIVQKRLAKEQAKFEHFLCIFECRIKHRLYTVATICEIIRFSKCYSSVRC